MTGWGRPGAGVRSKDLRSPAYSVLGGVARIQKTTLKLSQKGPFLRHPESSCSHRNARHTLMSQKPSQKYCLKKYPRLTGFETVRNYGWRVRMSRNSAGDTR